MIKNIKKFDIKRIRVETSIGDNKITWRKVRGGNYKKSIVKTRYGNFYSSTIGLRIKSSIIGESTKYISKGGNIIVDNKRFLEKMRGQGLIIFNKYEFDSRVFKLLVLTKKSKFSVEAIKIGNVSLKAHILSRLGQGNVLYGYIGSM